VSAFLIRASFYATVVVAQRIIRNICVFTLLRVNHFSSFVTVNFSSSVCLYREFSYREYILDTML